MSIFTVLNNMIVKEEIRIKNIIVHIMDATVGLPVLSDAELEYGSDFADFVRDHIAKLTTGDDTKKCEFYQKESEIYQWLKEYSDDKFVDFSKDAANLLYGIMNANVDIPSADLFVVRFRGGEQEYIALLKMNFKSGYTHKTMGDGEENYNDIIRYKAVLPTEGQKLSEAAIINLETMQVQAVEKKYDINGEKINYFSYLFLKCSSELSHKSKLNIVTKAIEKVQKDGLNEYETFQAVMEAKSLIQEELEEKGGFTVEDLGDKVFEEKADLRIAFQEEMEKYEMVKQEILPQSESTVRKYQKQHLLTDTGIEIKIPMEQYRNPAHIEFITNEDGTVSLLIKNIEHLQAKY